MADASYQPLVYRKQGAEFFVVASGGEISIESGGLAVVESGGELTVESGGAVAVESGGAINLEAGGYVGMELVALSSHLAPMSLGAMHYPTTTLTSSVIFMLPTPVAGAEVWFCSTFATTGSQYLCSGLTTDSIDRIICSSTEAGYGADKNNLLETSGGIYGLKAINSSMWVITSNIPASICTTIKDTTA